VTNTLVLRPWSQSASIRSVYRLVDKIESRAKRRPPALENWLNGRKGRPAARALVGPAISSDVSHPDCDDLRGDCRPAMERSGARSARLLQENHA